MAETNKKINWLRMLLCAAVLCIVSAACLIFYEGRGAEIIAELAADDKKQNLLWLAENAFAIIPVLLMVAVTELFYMNKKNYVLVYTQVEKLVAFGTAAFFIYGIMLTCIRMASVEAVDPSTGTAIQTLWDKTYTWFFSQILPLLIVICYHIVRVGSEKVILATPEVELPDEDDEDDEDAEEENNDE